MRFLYTIIFIFLFSFIAQAQAIVSSVVATAGAQATHGNIQMAYTIGQVFAPALKGKKQLTNGFNQPDVAISDIKMVNPENEPTLNQKNFKLYPNPATEFVVVEMPTTLAIDDMAIEVWNTSGQKIKVSNTYNTDQNALLFQIGQLKRSYYFFRLYRKSNQQPIATFRILKN